MVLYEALKKVRAFFFDVDGVMTDSQVHVWENGDLTRSMNVRDGFALKKAVDQGYIIVVITGGTSKGVELRLQKLGITEIYSGDHKKADRLAELLKKYHLTEDQALFMGDDILDLEAMQLCGVSACPSDAVGELQSICTFISSKKGGHGCVREVIELVMKVQESWHPVSGNGPAGI